MLLLKNILLINFLSHANSEIDFGENEQILLDGVSGAGKSSIAEALVWALYGQGRSSNSSLISTGKDKARVIVKLSRGNKTFKVEREVTRTGKHTLSVSESADGGSFKPVGVSGVKATQEYLENKIVGV